jgi:cytochrome P450
MSSTIQGSVDLDQFNPLDPAVMQCPFPHYAAMRSQRPVFQVPGVQMYFVTRHDLVLEVVRDVEVYSNQFASFGSGTGSLSDSDQAALKEAMDGGYPVVPTMLTADPPSHTRYRGLVTKAFTPKAIAELRPFARSVCDSLLDGILTTGEPVDFMRAYAVPLPVRVIAKALNVPADRLDDFKRWSDDSIAGIGTSLTPARLIESQRGIAEYQRYFASELEQRREEPRDDLLTRLVQARFNDEDSAQLGEEVDGSPLDMAEMLSIIQQLLVAGNETTTKFITETMRTMAERPDLWDAVRADATLISSVVEEGLRMATPTQGMFRVVRRDTELDGVAIPKGSTVVVMFASANRDEAFFSDPDRFDPNRANLRDHVAFGKGTHYCLGANLARLEGQVAFEVLRERVARIELVDTNTFEYEPSFILRGLKKLDVILHAA